MSILSADGETFFEDDVNCPSADETIIAERKCYIPNKVLNAAPFNLLWGTSVLAKVKTLNIVGHSPYSFVGNGAILLNGPSAPLNFAENRALTTSFTIGLVWTAGLDNGGSIILDYAVWSDQAIGEMVLIADGLKTTSYTVTNLSPGLVYTFQVVARNKQYWGDFSEELQVLAA